MNILWSSDSNCSSCLQCMSFCMWLCWGRFNHTATYHSVMSHVGLLHCCLITRLCPLTLLKYCLLQSIFSGFRRVVSTLSVTDIHQNVLLSPANLGIFHTKKPCTLETHCPGYMCVLHQLCAISPENWGYRQLCVCTIHIACLILVRGI